MLINVRFFDLSGSDWTGKTDTMEEVHFPDWAEWLERAALPERQTWKAAFLTTVRRRHYSYRTEQSYRVWLERFARFLGSDDLESRGGEEIKESFPGQSGARRTVSRE